MALQDILAAITAEADTRIEDARSAHQRALTQMREESERNLAKKKQELAVQKQQKMQVLEAKASTHAVTHKRNALLGKKKELLDRTYEKAIDALVKLDEKDTEALLRACIKQIKAKGVIHPSAKHEAMLKKICPSEQFKIEKATDAKGGFLFVSDKEEHDFTYEQIIEQMVRPSTELAVSSILF